MQEFDVNLNYLEKTPVLGICCQIQHAWQRHSCAFLYLLNHPHTLRKYHLPPQKRIKYFLKTFLLSYFLECVITNNKMDDQKLGFPTRWGISFAFRSFRSLFPRNFALVHVLRKKTCENKTKNAKFSCYFLHKSCNFF